MKKHIKIMTIILTPLSLMAFGFMDWNDSAIDQAEIPSTSSTTIDMKKAADTDEKVYVDFFYDVGSRFRGMTKADVNKARSLYDFLSEYPTQQIVSYKSLSVIIIKDDQETEIRETVYGDLLSFDQINLLQLSDYSTNFYIRADFQEKNRVTGNLEYNYATPYLTIVPEKQAAYVNGKDALLEYLSENNKENTANLNVKKLQPAKLYFTVSKYGTISNVRLDKSSGYPTIDDTMIELITNTSGKWTPAENSNGIRVDQELVVSFGIIDC